MIKNCCVVIYASLADIEAAIGKLKIARCDLKQASVIAYENETDIHNHQVSDRNTLEQLLTDTELFFVSGIGTLMVVGQMITLMSQGLENVEVGDDSNPLAVALFKMGVTRASIKEYERAIMADKLLLIFYAQQKDVEYVCDVLHCEAQQVIVHHA